MAREAYDPNIQGEIFASELSPVTNLLGSLQDLFLEFQIAKGLPEFISVGRESIQVLGRGKFHGLEALLG